MFDQIGPVTSSVVGITILFLFIFLFTKILRARTEHDALVGSHKDHKTSKMGKILKKAAILGWNKYQKTKEEKKRLEHLEKASILYEKNEKAHGMKGTALLDKLAAQEDKANIDNVSILQSLEGMQGRAIDMLSGLAILIQSLSFTDKNQSIIEAQESDEQKNFFKFTSDIQSLINASADRTDIIQVAVKQIDEYFKQLKEHFMEYADSYLIHSEDVMLHNIQFIKERGLSELKRVIKEAKTGESLFKKKVLIEKKDLTKERSIIHQAIKNKDAELKKVKPTDSAMKFQLEQQRKLLGEQENKLNQIEHYMEEAVKKLAQFQSKLDENLNQIKTSENKLETTFADFEKEYKKTLQDQFELRKKIHHLNKQEHDIRSLNSIEGAISIVSQALEDVQKAHDKMVQEETAHVFVKLEEFIRIAYEISQEVFQFETTIQTIETMESALTQAHEKMDINLSKIASGDLSSLEQDVIQTIIDTRHLIEDDKKLYSQMKQGEEYIKEQLDHLNTQFRLHQAELQRINGVYNQGIQNLQIIAQEAMKHTTIQYQQQTTQMSQ